MARATASVAVLLGATGLAGSLVGCGQPRGEAAVVTITEAGFDSPTVEVTAGTEVRWVNRGAWGSVLVSEDGWGSEPLSTGDTFAHRFETVGTYGYSFGAAVDPYVGTVTVVEP